MSPRNEAGHAPPNLLVTFAVMLAIVMFAVACGSSDASTSDNATDEAGAAPSTEIDLSDVTLRFGDQVKQIQTLLDASGQSADIPYTIEWSAFTSGPPLLQALQAEAIDAGVVGDAPLIFAQAADSPIEAVAAIRARSGGTGIVVPKGSSISTLKDLKGKKVAYVEGSAAQAFLLAALQKAGLSPDDIESANLQPADALAAFNSGNIDAWVIWDPYTAIAEKSGAKIVVTGDDGLTTGLTFFIARDAVVKEANTRAALEDFVQRVAKAGVWRNEHTAEWAEKFVQLTGLPIDVVETTLGRGTATYTPIDREVIADQQHTADLFSDAGVIPDKVDVKKVLNPVFNDLIGAIITQGSTTTTGGS